MTTKDASIELTTRKAAEPEFSFVSAGVPLDGVGLFPPLAEVELPVPALLVLVPIEDVLDLGVFELPIPVSPYTPSVA